ncbi:peptidylprolyl isomerase [Virgibacillus soli]|uniref:Foldase protein PrsA n=1 Tax=Paracerasibacillus soli TaxID=480284 RepID=A0ABU5CSE3_9BACI|nr:peptidylprolyl isomerase [Virgibacillus soli]MDY0409294.1 peptidylprolyl isomerase [Virgibacillus soli]
MRKSIIFILCIWLLAGCNGDQVEVIAETDVGDITEAEFYEQLKHQYGDKVLEEMLLLKVLEDKYTVGETEITAEINMIKEQYGDQFEEWLAQQGMKDEDALQQVIQLRLLQEEAIAEHLKISEEALQEKYERLLEDLEAQHILVEDKETAEKLLEQIQAGVDFNKLANEYSLDVDADDGGYLGYFSAGDTEPNFEKVAYEMQVGDISDPVETKFGYHLIKVTDRRQTKDEIGSFADVKKRIQRMMISEKISAEEEEEILNQILKNANVRMK